MRKVGDKWPSIAAEQKSQKLRALANVNFYSDKSISSHEIEKNLSKTCRTTNCLIASCGEGTFQHAARLRSPFRSSVSRSAEIDVLYNLSNASKKNSPSPPFLSQYGGLGKGGLLWESVINVRGQSLNGGWHNSNHGGVYCIVASLWWYLISVIMLLLEYFNKVLY